MWAHAAAGFDGQDWYQQLFDFGAPPGIGEEESDVVPALVRNIITPLASHLVSEVGVAPGLSSAHAYRPQLCLAAHPWQRNMLKRDLPEFVLKF